MYPISESFATYLRRPNRVFQVKAEVGADTYTNAKIVDFTVENSLTLGEEFEIGTAVLSKLTITLRLTGEVPSNSKVIPYLALAIDDGISEWLPLGEFYVDSREKVNDLWTFTCYDKLFRADVPYISSLTYPTTQRAVWDEICTRLGYTYDSTVVINPAYQLQVAPTGYTMRQVLGYLAGANSASVFVGKDGKIKFKRFSASAAASFNMTSSDYIRVKLTNPVKTYTRVVVTYDTDDDLTYEAGSGDEAHTLYTEIPFATQAITNNLLASLNGFSYIPIDMDARGYPQLEQGDVIGFTQQEGHSWLETITSWGSTNIPWNGLVNYQTLILHQVFTFKGGLKMSIQAQSKSDQQSEFSVDGSLTSQVSNLNKTAVKEGKPYYGATLTRTQGLTVERDDHTSKVILNSDKFTFQVGGVDKLYFDPVSNKYKFSGTLEGADGVFSGTLSAATINGGTISGTSISGSTISGGTITGGTINGGTITGSLIRTAAAGSRIELSTTGNLLTAYYSSDRYININPLFGSGPAIEFYYGGSSVGSILMSGANMYYNAVGQLSLNASGGVFISGGSWANLSISGQTMQAALGAKATSGNSTGSSSVFNCGIPIGTVLKDASGNSYTWSGVPAHSHAQI